MYGPFLIAERVCTYKVVERQNTPANFSAVQYYCGGCSGGYCGGYCGWYPPAVTLVVTPIIVAPHSSKLYI